MNISLNRPLFSVDLNISPIESSNKTYIQINAAYCIILDHHKFDKPSLLFFFFSLYFWCCIGILINDSSCVMYHYFIISFFAFFFLYLFLCRIISTTTPTPDSSATPYSTTLPKTRHLGWVPQSKLAFRHHSTIGLPRASGTSAITILQCADSLAAGGYIRLRQTRVFLRLKPKLYSY